MFSFIKELSFLCSFFFFYLVKKNYGSFIVITWLIFKIFLKQLTVAKLHGCFAVLEFENVICMVNLLSEIYNGLRYGWSFCNF